MDHNPSDPGYRANDYATAIQEAAAQRLKANRAVEQITEEILGGVGIEEGYSHNQVADYSTGWITIHPVIIERAVKAARKQITVDRSGTEDTLLIADKLREYFTQVQSWAQTGVPVSTKSIAKHLGRILDGCPWESQ